ncbi:MAG: bifunctional oligoribonuclease/PAP phosphatase NrnA, partial [Bacteroidia bacterium]|nr:bifunctional oligoribonuclease/PAP phosphatase NrnA [Bacteroidia bacterium]
MQEITELKELLNTPKNIIITTHKSPDGDAMGSSLALYNYLRLKNHHVRVVTLNHYPDFLYWLSGNQQVLVADDNLIEAEKLIAEAQLIFCLDFNTLKRIEYLGDWIAKSQAIKVMIDHHQQPEAFAKYTFSTIHTSSTCELIYDFIFLMNDETLINKEIGSCIYTGLITDTGSFRFNSTSANTLKKAAHLKEIGVNHCAIFENVYDTNTFSRLQLMGYTLCNRFKLVENLGVAYIWLSQQELNQYNYKAGDTEGFVNYGLSINGIKLSVFLVERDGQIKCSFRSKDPFDVNTFARKHFNGGGHKNASGGYLDLSLSDAVVYFLNVLNEYKNELKV